MNQEICKEAAMLIHEVFCVPPRNMLFFLCVIIISFYLVFNVILVNPLQFSLSIYMCRTITIGSFFLLINNIIVVSCYTFVA
jgi:hypothetical protein